ncbi:MAG: response regulator [Halobacteria archaeon]|nr:response regulator [Halobacteria archaeon]
MNSDGSEKLTVMVVDDQPDVTDTYVMWLESDFEVIATYGGDEALEKMTEDVDVVLLDRRMPGVSGDEVLDKIREQGYDCKVVMVTAVDPDFDIVSMGYDDYITKPVSKDELYEVIEQVTELDDYTEELQEYYTLVSKRALLESEKTRNELSSSDEYAELEERIEELEQGLDGKRDNIDSEGFVSTIRDMMDEEDK